MEYKEAKAIVDKCMHVIVSCKNQDQLNIAVKYSRLTYKLLAKEIGNNMNFISLVERSIGWAQCNIKNDHQTQIPGVRK